MVHDGLTHRKALIPLIFFDVQPKHLREMNQTFTAAIVGTGFIGPVHVEALKRLGVRVKGVLENTPERSVTAQRALGLEKPYESLEELLNDKEVQAVHLTVPNVLHYEMARQVLEAGKHVMCEKPLAMNSKETSELVALAAKTGLKAGVCYNLRFYPLNLHARQLIEGGELGDIFSIKGSYVQDWLMYPTDYNWRVLAEQGGALRAVADIGTHWMDLITTISGLEVEAVFADLQTVFPQRQRPLGEVETFTGGAQKEQKRETIDIDTEDGGSVLFRFKNGQKGQLWVSQVTAGRKNCLQYEIAGSKASLIWNSERPNELMMGQRNQANYSLLRDPGLLHAAVQPYTNYPGGHNEGFPDTFKQCFRSFYQAIEQDLSKDEVLFPTFAQGHKEVVLCEAILQSHQTERWVKVDA